MEQRRDDEQAYADWLEGASDGSGGTLAAVHRLGSDTLDHLYTLFEAWGQGLEASERTSGVIPLKKG